MLCRGDTRSLDYVWGCVQSDLMSGFRGSRGKYGTSLGP